MEIYNCFLSYGLVICLAINTFHFALITQIRYAYVMPLFLDTSSIPSFSLQYQVYDSKCQFSFLNNQMLIDTDEKSCHQNVVGFFANDVVQMAIAYNSFELFVVLKLFCQFRLCIF